MTDKDVLYCADAGQWRRWLEEHHADSPAVWLAIVKKASARSGPSYAEALDEALNGRWDAAYEGQATAQVPADLAAALAASPTASAFFDTLGGASRYAIIFRLGTVSRAETRARKIRDYVEMLERGEAPYAQGGSTGG